MSSHFQLSVISPEKTEFEGAVESIVVPGGAGYVGVLANHAPLLTTVGEGFLTFYDEKAKLHEYKVKGGFFEMLNNQAVVLVHEIGPPAKI